ncbi:hypothetical protein N5T90_05235 [Aliarcobacter cryaerophilus]|uniref:hypothetical protein n=1 Tax=Aliarcobacter cryaerophilus TaxID=28198 RepID=UPI0021B683DA|nr:hypothetical protein [Aliarcobacter cryaerophilus]MCT7470268.1 hypothetical protein [Aliarcobacter cryaerophilus]
MSKLYVGAHAGVSSFKGKDDADGFDMSGFAYGVQTGYIYDITKNIEFEFGLNYTKHDIDKTIANYKGTGASVKLEMKDSISTFAGINYKF